MKISKHIALFLLFTLITACSAKSPESTPLAPLPTPMISAEDLVETQCPLENLYAPEASARLPRVHSNGMCGLHLIPGDPSLIGLFLGYPAGWTIMPADETGTAIIFELEPRVIYFQIYPSDLTLENADQVTYSIEPGVAEPVVFPEEVAKDKSVQTIGDKQVLVLTTTLSEQTIARYFLTRSAPGKNNSLYMFQFTVLAPDMDNTQLFSFVESLIRDMSFDQ